MILSRYSDYGIPYEKNIYTSRDVKFNETELAGKKNVKDPSQGVTAPVTTANDASTTPITTDNDISIILDTVEETNKDMENNSIAGKTRKTTIKNKLPKKVLQEAVGATETPIKFIN